MVKSFDEYVNISEVYFECFAIVQDVDGYYGVIRDKKQDGLRKNNMINNLGDGSIPKLMAKLAIPAVVAQVVNLLYNIVDRIYIGHIPQIGADALTGVGLFTPVLMLINAFAMLAGSGGAPRAAIYMGKKDNATAEKIVGNCFTFLVICAIVLTAGFYGTLPVLLKWFGASSVTMPYALSYARIYVLGSIFVLIVLGMNLFITTQGFAKISMLTTVIGAVINIILDPVFIFVFNMGVQGAALATVLSQAVGAVWILHFLTDRKNYDIAELGLSVEAAKNLYTGRINAEVVNLLLENARFAELTYRIAQYFDDTFASGIAAQNAMLTTLSTLLRTKVKTPEAAKAAKDISLRRKPVYQGDLDDIEMYFMAAVKEIKKGIGSHYAEQEAMSKKVAEKMFNELTKGQDVQHPTITAEQLTDAMLDSVSGMEGATPEALEQLRNGLLGILQSAAEQENAHEADE